MMVSKFFSQIFTLAEEVSILFRYFPPINQPQAREPFSLPILRTSIRHLEGDNSKKYISDHAPRCFISPVLLQDAVTLSLAEKTFFF